MTELKEKNGIAKVAKKGDTMQKQATNAELEKELNQINIDAVIKKTALSRSIWKVEILSNYGTTEKSARRKLRTLQLDYSKAVIRELKLKNTAAASAAIQTLRKFYLDTLVSFDNFSNVSEQVNPDKFKIINTAYSFMNAESK